MRLQELTCERLIQFGKDRAKKGAGPVTIGMDIGYIKLVVSHAAAAHGIGVKVEPIDLARIALKRWGLMGKGRQNDQRPSPLYLSVERGVQGVRPVPIGATFLQ